MKQKPFAYQVVPDSKLRRWLSAAFRSARNTPMMHGLVEVDVTSAQTFLQEHKAKTGETLSFTAYIITCLAKAIEENKAVQAFRKGGKRLMLFDEVDVYTLIEREVGGQKQPIPYIIRAANSKTLREIHQEIRSDQVEDMEKVFNWLKYMPDLLFRPFFWIFSLIGKRYPQIWKKFVGTVGITAVGMFGKGAGWGIPPSLPTLMVTLGGIGEKPLIIDGHFATRDFLSLTISFNHEITDGAPAARFIKRFKELIESDYGLDDSLITPELVGAEATAG